MGVSVVGTKYHDRRIFLDLLRYASWGEKIARAILLCVGVASSFLFLFSFFLIVLGFCRREKGTRRELRKRMTTLLRELFF